MFSKLSAWTHTNRARLGQTGVTFALVWLWVTLVLVTLNVYAILVADGAAEASARLYDDTLPLGIRSFFGASVAGNMAWAFLGSCVVAPLVEETFRGGLCELCSTKDGRIQHFFLLMAGSFLGFGLLHGGGIMSIIVQGSLGLLLGRLWFRTNLEPDGRINKAWAYGANVFVHAAYNFCVFGMSLYAARSHLH